MEKRRSVFFVSDRTGITAEALGRSLMSQFDGSGFKQVTLPFIDSPEKAAEAVARINAAAAEDGARPVVFSTMVQDDLRAVFHGSQALCLDFFDTFIGPLERELKMKSSHTAGRAHASADDAAYIRRIDAVNFVLANDDGVTTRHYPEADVVLVGVSRSGKTPTCLYLALQYGVFAANYPLAEEDLDAGGLPAVLAPHRHKLFGLTIRADRLQQIRHERRPDSRYASLPQVEFELRAALALFARVGIPFLDTTECSIEEIASRILDRKRLERRVRL